MLEEEQGYLRTDIWYYDYTTEGFSRIIEKYAGVTFMVSIDTVSTKWYRYNRRKGYIESKACTNIGLWEETTIAQSTIHFIVPKYSIELFPFEDNEMELIINRKAQELMPKKIMVGQSVVF